MVALQLTSTKQDLGPLQGLFSRAFYIVRRGPLGLLPHFYGLLELSVPFIG